LSKSPTKNKTTIGDLTGYSGLNIILVRLNLICLIAYAKEMQQGFFTQFTDGTAKNTITNNVSVTLLFEFLVVL
jgi:hypothetical protein